MIPSRALNAVVALAQDFVSVSRRVDLIGRQLYSFERDVIRHFVVVVVESTIDYLWSAAQL